MPVYFANPGKMELDLIRTMGVNVKDNDSAIGYFGTGLKYAIATLLRTGHIISLYTNGETIQFRTKPKEIRGKMFDMIYMDDEQLGFTTDLGKNWEVWQAYREFYSNCLDERGTITSMFVENDTVFTVEGPEIMAVHAERSKIFLHGEPWLITEGVEIHRGTSQYVFYRGVRVHKLVTPSRFTYNLTVHMGLTEDRTLSSTWDMAYKLATRLPKVAEPEFCLKIVEPQYKMFEENLNFGDCAEPSEEFLDAIEKYREHAHLRETMRNMLKNKRAVTDFDVFTLSDKQADMVDEACLMLTKLNCYVKREEITFVEHLGPGVVGQAKDGKIILTRQCLANGKDFTAITIYEEWIHDKMGYHDESRGMQQFLFDKILELIKRKDV